MIIKFLILALIVTIKAVFSSFETAITYLNKAKFRQMSKNPRLKSRRKILKVKAFLDDKIKTFTTTRIGMTLAEQLASIFAAEAFVNHMVNTLNIWGLNNTISYIITVLIVTLLLSYLTLVFGELLPKKAARNHPERTVYRYVDLFTVFSKINIPFEGILTWSEKIFSKILRIKDEPEEKLTEKEIKLIIAESNSQGLFDDEEKKLLFNAIKFDSLKVREIMQPREKIVTLNIDSSSEKIIDTIKKYKYTRLPIYSKTKDNIIGFINLKDILLNSLDDKEININIKSLIREPLFITRNEKVDTVLKNMQLNNKHLAIIKEPNGVIEGLITMEDIVEKLVGNILDEYNK